MIYPAFVVFGAATLCVLQQCQGLQLSLERDTPTPPGGRAPCGVLTCVEVSPGMISASSSNSSSSPVAAVTRMAVYKTDHDQPTESQGEVTLVASVDSEQPRISRVADAMKTDGRLEPSATTLTLELFKPEDCRAEFTCEVLALDVLGRELVRTSHLLQQSPPTPAPDTAGKEGWTPAVAMHLLDLVQQLSTSVELMRSAVDTNSERLSGVEDRMSDKFTSVEKELWNAVSTTKSIDTKLDLKFELLEDKCNYQKQIKTVPSTIASQVDSFGEELKQEMKDLLKEELLSLQLNVSKVSSDFIVSETSIKSNIEQSFNSLKQEMHKQTSVLTENLEDALDQTCSSSTKEIVSQLNSLQSLEDTIDGRFQKLTASIKENAVETRSLIEKSADHIINATDASEIANELVESVTLRSCMRGTISLLTQPSYPYSVVKPRAGDTLTVPHLCDTATDGGGWIVIQRRTTGNVDFFRTWQEYKVGFGTLYDDFWLGNDNIHAITSSGVYELRVELRYNGKSAYANYENFGIGDESNQYTLSLGTYSGTAGDSLGYHNGQKFSTWDRDNFYKVGNCSILLYTGAWWYRECHFSDLNGKWKATGGKGPRWRTFSGYYPVSFTEMKIRRITSP